MAQKLDALAQLAANAGNVKKTAEQCGLPLSTLYHRYLYESRLKRVGARQLGALQRLMLTTLGMALNADRLFVGVERGALGYLLIARCASLVTIENTGQ